jgi:hypothetical protein
MTRTGRGTGVRGGALLLLALCACPTVRAQEADAPLLWRNSAAFTAPAGLPRARTARLPAPGRTAFALGTEIASQFTQDAEGRQDAIVDVETTAVLLSVEHGFSTRWSAGIEVPFLSHDGGFLDRLIDGYHDAFGFPDGGRDTRPRDDVRVVWREDGARRRALLSSAAGLGDVRVHVARALTVTPERQTALRLGVELPTGEVDELTGNDGVDLSVALHLTDRRLLSGLGWTLHGAAGVLAQLDHDALYGGDGEALTAFGNLTLAWPLSERWTLKGQLDAHSRTADTPLRQVGGWGVQASLGAAVRLGEQLVFEGGFVEDLPPGSAPDIAFLFALRGVL